MKRIGLLSDTHSYMDEKILKHLSSCDEIWHAGDIGSLEVSDQLKAIKPLRAVYGNIDNHEIRSEFPKDQRFLCEEMDVWMTHIGGKPGSYYENIRKILLENPPQIFICGHSHILRVQYDKKFSLLHLNPGAAGTHGFHSKRTLLRFSIEGNQIKDMEIVELGLRAKTGLTHTV